MTTVLHMALLCVRDKSLRRDRTVGSSIEITTFPDPQRSPASEADR